MIRSFFSLLLLTTLLSTGLCQQPQGPGFSSRETIAQRLAEVRQELLGLGKETGNSQELVLLRHLETTLVQHREALDYLDQVKKQADGIRDARNSWKGLKNPPPYSVQFADRLRAQLHSLQRQADATDSRLRIISSAIDEANAQLSEHQRLARQLREDAASSGSTEAKQQAQSAARLEVLSSRVAAETLARLQLRHDADEIKQNALAEALEVATLEADAVKGKVRFTKTELEEIQQKIAAERKDLLDLEQQETGSASGHSRQLTWKIDILNIERDFWNAAFLAFNAKSSAGMDHAIGTLQTLQAKADDWVELIRLQAGAAIDEEIPTIGAIASRDDIKRVVNLQLKIRYVLELLGNKKVSVTGVLDQLADALSAFWGMELYLAEETNSVAGEKVTTYSAVTLGKILRLVIILLIGWFVLRFLARRLHAFLLHRFGGDAGRADLVRSWTFGLGLTILLIYGLNRVHIPFTAFAFLGGTLAIGIGFGAQTLLKNFISGVILSLERPFKVGDLVEVDNIMGNIIRIGLRASVIRHFDGTDTLVPNSTLLENRVSNWTFADNAMRGEIEIGIAYGSPTRDVSRTLLSAAESHGLVLKKPPSSVRFDSFADNALKFTLLYWFDAKTVREEILSSDLRFMIDGALASAGIVIAYPQRDIHFDSQPLRVELSRRSNRNGGET